MQASNHATPAGSEALTIPTFFYQGYEDRHRDTGHMSVRIHIGAWG